MRYTPYITCRPLLSKHRLHLQYIHPENAPMISLSVLYVSVATFTLRVRFNRVASRPGNPYSPRQVPKAIPSAISPAAALSCLLPGSYTSNGMSKDTPPYGVIGASDNGFMIGD